VTTPTPPQRPQEARGVVVDQDRPPQIVAVGHLFIRREADPGDDADHSQDRHDPRRRQAGCCRASTCDNRPAW